MGSITWKGEGNDPEATTKWGGQEFKAGEAVKTDDPVLLRKAQNNPMFEVSGFKDEGERANVVGNYTDSLTGRDVTLIAKEPRAAYAPAPVTPGPSGPVAGTSGSFAG